MLCAREKYQSVESRLSAGGAYFNLKVPRERERKRSSLNHHRNNSNH
jgi:hypothetical protein